MVQLSEVSRRDNSNMRSVAVVGLIYLPATFVSGLFGMNFFQFCGGSDNDDAWKVSEKFWLYWAVTIPLTLATVLVWTLAFHADRIKVSLKKLRKYGGV
jgi:Mg2+ and Co2+ transporter CorA